MRVIIFLIVIFQASLSFGQDNQDSISISTIQQVIKCSKKDGKIIYSNKVSPHFSDYKEKLTKKNPIFYNHKGDSIILSRTERDYIIHQLGVNQKYIWKEYLFKNSQRMDFDSIWTYVSKNSKNEAHIFSKPIFIRNNSICLIYHLHLMGVGGPDYFGFFKKQNGEWKEWISISTGILN